MLVMVPGAAGGPGRSTIMHRGKTVLPSLPARRMAASKAWRQDNALSGSPQSDSTRDT
jgi:hypothetical protein